MGAAASAAHRRRAAPSQAALIKRAALADDARVLEVRAEAGSEQGGGEGKHPGRFLGRRGVGRQESQ